MTQQLQDLTLEQLFAQAEVIGAKYSVPECHRGSGRNLNPWDLPTAQVMPIPASGKFRHIVAVLNPVTMDEKILVVETDFIDFTDVLLAIDSLKVEHGLNGYHRISAVLERPAPF
jgi:hypothetical protein